MATVYGRALSPAQLKVMQGVWNEAMDDLADDTFMAACTRHVRQSPYFPCPADIRKEADACPPAQAALACEAPLTPEECQRSALFARMVHLSVHGGQARAKDFFAPGISEEERQAIAREVLNSLPDTGARQ